MVAAQHAEHKRLYLAGVEKHLESMNPLGVCTRTSVPPATLQCLLFLSPSTHEYTRILITVTLQGTRVRRLEHAIA